MKRVANRVARALGRPRDPYWWLEGTGQDIFPLDRDVQHPRQMLMSLDEGGAIFFWTFDEDFTKNVSHCLVGYVTDREAEQLLKTPHNEGFLERVRPRIKHQDALIMGLKDGARLAGPRQLMLFRIPRDGGEESFIDCLLDRTETPVKSRQSRPVYFRKVGHLLSEEERLVAAT